MRLFYYKLSLLATGKQLYFWRFQCTPLIEVFPRQFYHHGTEQQYADQVGDRHQAVEGIGDIPRQLEIHGGSYDDHRQKHQLVDQRRLGGAEQILTAPAAV